MNIGRQKILLFLLNNASIALFISVFLVFGLLSDRFLDRQNLTNILIQSSSIAIVATGMTFVLLTAGVDLSVGAIMFVGAAVAGKLVLGGQPMFAGLVSMLGIGILYGAVNAFFVSKLRIMAFVVTLATLYIGRGAGLWITETRAMNLPGGFLEIGAIRIAGLPLPIVMLIAVVASAHLVLQRTPFGRQVYAVGSDADAARKAGINVPLIIASVYVISGFCAALGGIISLAQLGAVSPSFGWQREFPAIAAAVLGGTSLFGGRGKVLPGTLLGAILIQTIENGLVILNADPYLYPLITSAIIFIAVLIDSIRFRWITKVSRRKIRIEKESA